MIFDVQWNNFVQQTSSSDKCSVKQVMRNFSGINFSYTNRMYFALVIRVYFDKNLLKSISTKHHGQTKLILKSFHFTECFQQQALQKIQQ